MPSSRRGAGTTTDTYGETEQSVIGGDGSEKPSSREAFRRSVESLRSQKEHDTPKISIATQKQSRTTRRPMQG